VLGPIPAAQDADAIVYGAVSDRVSESGVAAGNGKLYVNIVDYAEIVEIDGTSLTVTRRWSTAPCGPAGRHDHRHDASTTVQRLSQRRAGDL
jgi:hypothetical protein